MVQFTSWERNNHYFRKKDLVSSKYERGEAVPPIEAAKKMAEALGVTLDYLAGEASRAAFDRRTVERIQDIEQLEEGEKQHVFALLDAFLAKNKMQAILK